MRIMALFTVIGLFFLIAGKLPATGGSTVTHYSGPSISIAERMEWAKEERQALPSGKGCWIGYTFTRHMGANSFIGTFNSDPEKNRPSISELIYGITSDDAALSAAGRDFGKIEGNFTITGGGHPADSVEKQIAIILHWYQGRPEPDRIQCSNVSLHFNFGSEPIFWLGSASSKESIGLLGNLWEQGKGKDLREGIIGTIGMHPPLAEQTEFLTSVLNGDAENGLRADAAFWLGNSGVAGTLRILERAAAADRSEDVREKAVFAISTMDDSSSLSALIRLARDANSTTVRKLAVFWLGQRASARVAESLNSIVEDDDNPDVRKNALFALSQMPDGCGVTPLISIARSHRDPQIRKDAIFMLSQVDDPRAFDALVSIAAGK